jgi:hypothetical protein
MRPAVFLCCLLVSYFALIAALYSTPAVASNNDGARIASALERTNQELARIRAALEKQGSCR